MSVPRITLSLPGENITFEQYTPGQVTWSTAAGIYMFSAHTPSGWLPQYIGQTVNFSQRPGTHDRWAEAARRGATVIHAVVVATAAERDRIEKRLIQHFDPPLNTHHRGLVGLGGLRTA